MSKEINEESIAAQIVVYSSSRILSIVAAFRNDKSNSRILQCSTLYKDVELGLLLKPSPVSVNGEAIGEGSTWLVMKGMLWLHG